MANLAEALSLAALVAATLEHAILVRHREERRDEIRWREVIRDSSQWGRRYGSPWQRRWVEAGARYDRVAR
ncbi:MAG TPA: hypothetical protein VHK63_01165 [Candidatus Limnocylindria bacterium]|nr:hypothetical protein [Candidatus Limnocylindria bacterium]